jgi:hypothetical protein
MAEVHRVADCIAGGIFKSKWNRDPWRIQQIDCRSLPCFRRQNNHPRKLQDRGNKVKSDPGEERPECAEQGGIVQLQQCDSDPESPEQISHKVRTRALQPV